MHHFDIEAERQEAEAAHMMTDQDDALTQELINIMLVAASEKTLLERAIAFATSMHAGQIDKSGLPVILHPLRVMLSVGITNEIDIEKLRAAAVLHDVVEDTPATLDHVRLLFGKTVRKLVDSLTRRDDESYFEFVARTRLSYNATRIKRLDIADNISRGASDSMVQRYEKALKILG